MFNDSYAVKRFAELVSKFGIETTIETGTHLGVGALGASAFCKHVVTIEINPEFRDTACQKFLSVGYHESDRGVMSFNERVFVKNGHWIFSYLGNSPEVLEWVLSQAEFVGPFFFYVDAHWGDYLPIHDELSAIARNPSPGAVMAFHDFLVPGLEDKLRCDEYHGTKLSYEFVKGDIAAINPNFKTSYNSESTTGIGILYCTP